MSFNQVFVYGTLKRGQPNHRVLLDKSNGEARFQCSVLSEERWPLVIASQFNIPYLIPKQGSGHQVKGEVYEVDDRMLRVLDEFEGHPQYYERRRISVVSEEGSQTSYLPYAYFISRYQEWMLKLPTWSDYDSRGEHGLPYVQRCDRQGPGATCGHTESKQVQYK